MRRLITALLASLLLAGLLGPVAGVAVGATPASAADAVAKVVIVVGPAGGATDRYRKEARAAAALARRYTPDVTELYSPNATWPAVREALQGASLIVYMGHGNGWPSKYRDSLYPPSQNGFGLNPEAGGGDSKHQYFGEARIAESITLAKNAVVLLSHLCYASGNSEPGLAEGTLDQAQQRVDNYAAGFITAGAAAVVAEAYASPNHMIKAVLGGGRSIESAWRNAPSKNGNAFAFKSERSAGYIAQMDPERGTSGFARSIVLKAGLASADVLANARGSATAIPMIDAGSLVPSLAAAGIQVQQPVMDSTAAGETLKFSVKYTVDDRKALPKKLMASVRWDALDPVAVEPAAEVTDAEAPAPGDEAAAPAGDAATQPAGDAAIGLDADAGTDPAAGATTDEAAAADEPAGPPVAPNLGLVTTENLGEVVDPVKIKIAKKTLSFKVKAPTEAGRYRLTVVLHDADGVAFDAATQRLLPTLIVRVTGELDAQIVAPSRAEIAPEAESSLDLWVANLGQKAWGHGAVDDPEDPGSQVPATSATVSGQWVATDADPDSIAAAAAAGTVTGKVPAGLKPGAVVDSSLALVAPAVAGEYLLLLDVVTPEHGSLVASGLEPVIVRVTVAVPEPTPVQPAPTVPAATPE